MADIKHTHAAVAPTGPTEGDGISYRGIVWFVVILAVTTLGCQLLMWWFHVWQVDRAKADAKAAAAPFAVEAPPQPNLISLDSRRDANGQPIMPLGEATNLERFREGENTILSTYGWVDQNAGVVRIPIDRAKAILLERGFPVRTAATEAAKGKDKD